MTSRLTVEGERPNPVALARNDRSAAKPREISSRSANDNRNSHRGRGAGRTPPTVASAVVVSSTIDRYGHLYSDASEAVTAAMSAAFAAPKVLTSNVMPLRTTQ